MSSDEGGNSAATRMSEFEQMLKQVTVARTKIQHPNTMEDLPHEILSNIFILLYAKQLAQMRSVSKSWNGLLSQPSFVKSHLHRSIHNNNQQALLVFPNFIDPFVQFSCESPHLGPTNVIKHIPTNLPMSWVIGSVNGLICVSEIDYSSIHIWNPSLSAISTIPPPHSLPPMSHCETSIRFGFDPKTDDYKLVKISGIRNRYVKEWLKVEVYSMRKRCWEFITQPFPSHITWISSNDGLCVDGHLHWENQTGPLREHTIVGFDLGSETFREIPLPDSILDSNHTLHRLGVLGGKLCEMSWGMVDGWEVWVMEEYGVPESWVKRHVLSQFTRNICLYGFTSRNELLLKDTERLLVMYDPITNKTISTWTKQKAMKIVEYVDSLVWI